MLRRFDKMFNGPHRTTLLREARNCCLPEMLFAILISSL
jgi:hypothetical protein